MAVRTSARVLSGAELGQTIETIATQFDNKFGHLFLDAVKATINSPELNTALSYYDRSNGILTPYQMKQLDQATTVHLPVQELTTIMNEIMVKAATATQKSFPQLRQKMSFDVSNPRAVEYARIHSAQLVQATEEAKGAIRNVVADGLARGTPRDLMVNRIKRVIGLTPQYAQAVTNMRNGLLTQGVAPGRAEAQANNYASQLREHRAVTIARNETLQASQFGRSQTWLQLQAVGIIPPKNVVAQWLIADDERTCPICQQLEGIQRSLDEWYHAASGAYEGPHAHITCRCTEILVYTDTP